MNKSKILLTSLALIGALGSAQAQPLAAPNPGLPDIFPFPKPICAQARLRCLPPGFPELRQSGGPRLINVQPVVSQS